MRHVNPRRWLLAVPRRRFAAALDVLPRRRFAAALTLCVALALACGGKGKPGDDKAGGPGGPPGGGDQKGDMRFPVEVAEIEAQRVEYTVKAVGSIEPNERVQVTARVAGVVERVRFREGDAVTTGRVLVEIEPQRYRVAVASAQAALAHAETSKTDAEASLARREQAVAQHPGLIPGEEVEGFRTKGNLAAAEAAQARAALEQAQLNLRDALLRAPIAGVIQTKTVETGQYVQPGTVLATLLRRDPLRVHFKVPEGDAAQLKPGMQARFRVQSQKDEHVAVIAHVAQAAEDASRMVPVIAEVARDEDDASLRPGAFAEVVVPVGASVEAPVIPEIAIRASEAGFIAFVVQDGVAKQRTLALGMRTADRKVEVRSGLEIGELLVVRGAEALRDGAAVRIADGPGAERKGGGQPEAAPHGNGSGPRAERQAAPPAAAR
jgi:multidrug efflux system membrane fusion protein